MDFTIEELEEIKRALNTMIAQRVQYSIIEANETRRETNDKYKKMDYELLEKIIKEMDGRKEDDYERN